MKSMHAPADAGQLAAEILGDFVAAQQRLYTPQVQRVLDTPRAVVHDAPDHLRAEQLALIAGANCLRRQVELASPGNIIAVSEAREILIATLECMFRALDQAKVRS